MERDHGFYWVKFYKDFDWVICEWIGHCWLYSRGDGMYFDHIFYEIDEERITRD